MNALYYYLFGFIIVWIVAVCLRQKPYISIEGIAILLKTDKLRGVIDRIANISHKFWKWFTNLLMPLGVFLIILMVVTIIYSLTLMYTQPTVSLILPGVDIPGSPLYIPFATGLLALATVMIIHEGGHGVLARVEGVDIDSVGLLLFLIIPGAFVEPNQKQIEEANGFSKLRIYFAGPMANIILCIIALLISAMIGGFIADENMYTSNGMEITSVVPGSPAEGVLQDGMIITAINNQTTNNIAEYSKVVNNTHIGDSVNITTKSGLYTFKLAQNPNNSTKGYIGIRCQEHKIVTAEAQRKYGNIIPAILPTINELFSLIFILNFSVGTFNLLPMKPLDGGLILEEILRAHITDKRRKEFNDALNKYTKILPMSIRCFLSRRLNSIINWINKHQITDEKIGVIIRCISTFFIVILIMLIVYGTLPGIMKMI